MSKRTEDSRQKGDLAEKLFELECIKRGIAAYKPINSNGRVDYIIQTDVRFERVQIKYISMYEGKISVTFSKNQNGRKTEKGTPLYKKYTTEELDMFLVYCPDTSAWYSIPIKLSDTCRCITLTTTTPKNNQQKKINFATDYIW